MKTRFAQILALAVAITMLACMSAPAMAEGSEVTGTITWVQHRTDLEPEMNALIEAFEAEYPGITVEMETLSGYENVIGIRIAGGDKLPDVLEFSDGVCPRTEWAKYFEPLTDSKWAGKTVGDAKFTVDGEIYGYTYMAVYDGFMYNKTLWAEAGIEAVPTTWDEFVEDLKKLAELDGVIPMTSQYKTGWPLTYWYHYACAMKGEELTLSWPETNTPFSDECLIAAADHLKGLIDAGLMDPDVLSSDWDLQASDFVAGMIGTYLTGSYAYGTMTGLGMDGDEIGYFPMPSFANDGTTYLVGSPDWGLGVAKTSENKEAAKLFVDFATEHYCEYASGVSAIVGGTSDIPCISDLLNSGATAVGLGAPNPQEYTDINAIAGLSITTFLQEYVVAEDPQAVVDSYNAKWAAARAELGME